MGRNMRFAFFGAGFWARAQMSVWKELSGVQCTAVYNRTRTKGERFAKDFGIPKVYDNPRELFEKEKIDFVDLCTNPFSLPNFVRMAASYKVPVISQKPMAPSVAIGEELVATCKKAGIKYLIHENWRWQPCLRQFKTVLDSGKIGTPFRARITLVSGYDFYSHEPTLAELEHFLLTDSGTHILDIARLYFGETESVYCVNQRIHPHFKGEDVCTVMMIMNNGKTAVTCELGYPENFYERESFLETMIFVEGDKGSAEVAQDYWIRVTTKSGTFAKQYKPVLYPWMNPAYLACQSGIVPCNQHMLQAMRGDIEAETTGEDNLKTIKLVWACYKSAGKNRVVKLERK